MDNIFLHFRLFLCLQFYNFVIPQLTTTPIFREICTLQTFNPKCTPHSVIIIHSALYGRMKLGVCKVTDHGYLGCSSDVKQIISHKCAGRQSCSLLVPDADLEAAKLCGEELFNYLEVEYSCQNVVSSGICNTCNGLELKGSSGYISSQEAMTSKCGLSSCPWTLNAPEGQTIKLTLHDFSYEPDRLVPGTCQVYAIVENLHIKKSYNICGKETSDLVITNMSTNIVSISLINPNDVYFLIYYEFNGCSDLQNENFVFTRSENQAKVKCLESDVEFLLTCEIGSWTNLDSIDCSSRDEQISQDKTNNKFPISLEYLALLISSIAFLIGACILVCGIYAFCRKPNPNVNSAPALYKDIPVYDYAYNHPIRHPGREFMYVENPDEDTIMKSFPRMNTEKNMHNLHMNMIQAPTDPRIVMNDAD